MNHLISKIENFLIATDNRFVVEKNKQFGTPKADLFALRKAGMAGKDFIFFHDLSNIQSYDLLKLEFLHEEARKYANSFYKLPKIFRFSVPNIVSFFISQNEFSKEIIDYANKSTRTISGGEIHSVYLIDLHNKNVYGQGKSFVRVDGIKFEFKNINPQNRAYYLATGLYNCLFNA